MYGRRKVYALSAFAVLGFIYGFNYEIVNNYFNTPYSIIGLLLTAIILLAFWIFNLKERIQTIRNSCNYHEGQESQLKQQIEWYKEQIKNKDQYIKETHEIYFKNK